MHRAARTGARSDAFLSFAFIWCRNSVRVSVGYVIVTLVIVFFSVCLVIMRAHGWRGGGTTRRTRAAGALRLGSGRAKVWGRLLLVWGQPHRREPSLNGDDVVDLFRALRCHAACWRHGRAHASPLLLLLFVRGRVQHHPTRAPTSRRGHHHRSIALVAAAVGGDLGERGVRR